MTIYCQFFFSFQWLHYLRSCRWDFIFAGGGGRERQRGHWCLSNAIVYSW